MIILFHIWRGLSLQKLLQWVTFFEGSRLFYILDVDIFLNCFLLNLLNPTIWIIVNPVLISRFVNQQASIFKIWLHQRGFLWRLKFDFVLLVILILSFFLALKIRWLFFLLFLIKWKFFLFHSLKGNILSRVDITDAILNLYFIWIILIWS